MSRLAPSRTRHATLRPGAARSLVRRLHFGRYSFRLEDIRLGPACTVWVGGDDIGAIKAGAPFIHALAGPSTGKEGASTRGGGGASGHSMHATFALHSGQVRE